ncbi:MAG: Plastocyanin [Microgenomates group bacterium GW2011_GWC1_37_8]|uniref:Plastocyanin n=1 Tax=Candidatus Woesebacteria bacterium GW2011_GWB1_38_8 TaxID=1618570 RepID=A0A0G0L3V0_9BACT|nr:MAG: Plastocyanin [Microgenomates group bacterium GW2011_GWC1_37_8]KKQ85677.1 MAG: Plastocyanin [Candidatus Woesebacteria bacterium GW2011_GWB1_38_8]
MNKGILIGGLALFVLVVMGYILMTRVGLSKLKLTPKTEVPATSDNSTQEAVVEEFGAVKDGVREIAIDADEYSFFPEKLTIKQGEKVRITFNNLGSTSHDFVIDELNVKTELIPVGSSGTVEFTADKSGVFNFYCSVGNHESLGMVGELDVINPE